MMELKFKNNFEKIKEKKSDLIFGRLIENPDFTVCLPIHGIGKFLNETLLNIINLDTFGLRIQYIVSNNGVNIDFEHLNELFKNISNVAIYHCQYDIGQYNNFNRCAELSNTKFFTILHDDDLLNTNYFYFVKLFLNSKLATKNIGMIHQKQKEFTSNIITNDKFTYRLYPKSSFEISVDGGTKTGFPTCGIILNKEAFLISGGYNDEYYASGDAFLSLAIIKKGYTVYQSLDVFGYYRIAVNSSLNINICREFIKEDVLFRDYWYNKSFFRKKFYSIYKNFFYSEDIKTKVLLFREFNSQISVESLDFKNTYKRYSKFGFHKILYFLLKVIKNIYIGFRTFKL